MRTLSIWLILLCCTAPIMGRADVVVLQDGASLSGTMVRITENTLVFRTNLSGQMMTPMDRVISLTTDRNFMVTMKDKTTLYGRLALQDTQAVLLPLNGDAAQPVALGDIEEAMAIPAATISPPTAPETLTNPLNGVLEAGAVARRHGEEDGQGRIRLEMGGKGESLNWGTALEVSGDDDGVGDNLQGSLLLQGGDEAAWRPYLSAGALRDADNDLRFRGNLSLGVYHAFFPEGMDVLDAYFGVDVDREEWIAGDDASATDTGLNLHLGLRYFKVITHHLALSQAVDMYPGLSDISDYHASSETALLMPLGGRLRLRVNFSIGYDSTPGVASADRWSSTLGAGVGVSF